jgi:hypothetical protein
MGEGGTVIIDTSSSIVMRLGELGMSREPREAGMWEEDRDRRPPAFVEDRLWSGDVVSGGVLSSSAVRFVVTMAGMWSSEGMAERKGA